MDKVEKLIRELRDKDWRVRWDAALALREIGDERAVEPLINALRDEYPDVCRAAAEALGKIGDKKAIEPLIIALRDKDWRVRWDAALALREIGDKRAVEPLINALRDGSPDVCRAAAEALGKIGDKKAIEPLIIALRSLFVRYAAIEALEKIEPEWHKTEVAKKQVPEFINALRNGCSDVRIGAAEALGKIGDKKAIEPLIIALRDWDWRVRYAAIEALEKIEPEWHKTEVAKKQVPEFINALRDKNSDIRKATARVLGKIGDERAIEPLIIALRDKYEWVRKAAAKALVKIGKPAVESLIQTLRDEDPDVRWAAAYVLGNIGDLRAIEPLIQTLRDENSFVREAAVYALGKIEPEWYKTEAAGRQVPEFVKILVKAKDEKYCNYLKELTEKIFPSHKPFLDSYPYLLCTNCMLRAEKRKAKLGLFKRCSYVVCRGCGTAEALIIGIKKVVGIIGGNINNYSIDGDTAYVRLWFEKEKSARNADIDMLLITESEDIKDENEYDKAIDAVYNLLVNDHTRPRKYIKKIPVLIQGNLPLSIRAKRVLENEFGGVTHM